MTELNQENGIELKIQFESVIEILKVKTKKDPGFNKELGEFVSFFGSKFVNAQPDEVKKEIAANLIEDVIFAQVAHGYWLFANELAEDKVNDGRAKTFESKFWQNTPGLIRNITGIVALQIFKENWFMAIGSEEINLRILQELPDSFNLYLSILEETAIFGGYLALRDDDNYKPLSEENDMPEILLANPKDITYINPQVYMQYGFFSNQHENWELILGATGKREERWIGTVHLSSIPTDGDSKTYYLNIMLDYMLMAHEKSRICKTIIQRLPQEIQETVQFRVYHLDRSPEVYEAKKFLNY